MKSNEKQLDYIAGSRTTVSGVVVAQNAGAAPIVVDVCTVVQQGLSVCLGADVVEGELQ